MFYHPKYALNGSRIKHFGVLFVQNLCKSAKMIKSFAPCFRQIVQKSIPHVQKSGESFAHSTPTYAQVLHNLVVVNCESFLLTGIAKEVLLIKKIPVRIFLTRKPFTV